MSITQDDFKKIWASTSSVPEYTFSDSDYQDGWEFVGNLPPTRAMWDTLQRRNDQKMKYLQDKGSMCFDSVADMVASNLEAGQTVITKGYYSVNDGGAAVYTIRTKTQSDVEDGGSIIFLSNGNVAELITAGTVNVKQFGAYGDGTHDDTVAIQHALDYVDAIKGRLYCTAGTYIYSKYLYYGNLYLYGDGIGKTIFKLIDNFNVAEASGTRNKPFTGFLNKEGSTNIDSAIFRDIEIDGNSDNNRHWYTTNPYGSWAGIQDLTQCHGIRVENTDMPFGGTAAIPKYIEISDCYIHDTIRDNVSIVSYGRLVINKSVFKNSDTDHLLYLQTASGETFVNDCVIKGFANGHIQSSKAQYNNLVFREIKGNPASVNVANPYVVLFIALDRTGQLSGINIDNLNAVLDIEEIGTEYNIKLFSSYGYITLTNSKVEYKNPASFTDNISFIFYSESNDVQDSGATFENVVFENVIKGTPVFYVGHNADKGIYANNVRVSYATRDNGNVLFRALGVAYKDSILSNCRVENSGVLVYFNGVNASQGRIYINDSYFDLTADAYIRDGQQPADGLIRLTNVVVGSFRYGNVLRGVHYDNVRSLDGNDIKYIGNPPDYGNDNGDMWYKNGALKIWNGTAWVAPTIS